MVQKYFAADANASPKVCPTGKTIFRYVDTMTRHIKSVIPGKSAPSLSSIHSIWHRLICLLVFRHQEIKTRYGPHGVKRIEVRLDQLVKKKLLIKGRFHKKQWLGFRVMERMARIWIHESISNGCISWDRVLLKLLSVILMSALAARCGDIGRFYLYKEMECLCWSDVELTLASYDEDRAPSVQDLRAKFALRFLKCRK
jgi:hypothetical protein